MFDISQSSIANAFGTSSEFSLVVRPKIARIFLSQ